MESGFNQPHMSHRDTRGLVTCCQWGGASKVPGWGPNLVVKSKKVTGTLALWEDGTACQNTHVTLSCRGHTISFGDHAAPEEAYG